MDKSQLQRLATQAGFTSAQRSNVLLMESLRVFAKAIEAQVREECAMMCEKDLSHHYMATAEALGYGKYFAGLLRNT